MWTTRHGRLIPAGATVAQVDLDPARARRQPAGRHRRGRRPGGGRRGIAVHIATAGRRRAGAPTRCANGSPPRAAGATCPIVDDAPAGTDRPAHAQHRPRRRCCPPTRTVVIDSGNFMGYPSMFLSVPDAAGFCFTQAFQSIGLGLASALGAAVARPDRLTVAALGDGGFLMSAAELATAARLGLPLRGRGLRRRGVRRRGAPLRPGRAPAGHSSASRTPTWPRSARGLRLRRGSPCARPPTWRRCATGSPARATGRWSSTPRSARCAARGGSRRPSAATDWPGFAFAVNFSPEWTISARIDNRYRPVRRGVRPRSLPAALRLPPGHGRRDI